MIEALNKYYVAAEQEAREAAAETPLRELEWMIAELPQQKIGFAEALQAGGVSVIAEHKRRSPSQGDIRPGSDVASTVRMYQEGGASAVSILTQGKHFGGRAEDLTEANHATELPILRKDFISEKYQLYQARALGASAVLLIVAGLSEQRLRSLHDEATGIGLDCLVEVHDEIDLDNALGIAPAIIGINNRNLATLEEDLETTRELIEEMPSNVMVVAESGYSVRKPEHITELRELEVDAVLMGTALMREDDPAEALRNWLTTPLN